MAATAYGPLVIAMNHYECEKNYCKTFPHARCNSKAAIQANEHAMTHAHYDTGEFSIPNAHQPQAISIFVTVHEF
jgi:hypothetical protein